MTHKNRSLEGLGALSTALVLVALAALPTAAFAKKAHGVNVPALAKRIDPERIAADDTGETAARAAKAVTALAAAGGERGHAALRERLTALHQKRMAIAKKLTPGRRGAKVVSLTHQLGRVMQLEMTIVKALAAAHDARLRDDLLDRLPKENLYVRGVYLRYLEKTAKNDQVVKARLKKLYDSPSSPLHHSFQLKPLVEKK